MTTKISETFLGGRTHQNPAFQQKKIDQKITYEGPRAVALILAFIAISKAQRPKMEKIKPLSLLILKKFSQ